MPTVGERRHARAPSRNRRASAGQATRTKSRHQGRQRSLVTGDQGSHRNREGRSHQVDLWPQHRDDEPAGRRDQAAITTGPDCRHQPFKQGMSDYATPVLSVRRNAPEVEGPVLSVVEGLIRPTGLQIQKKKGKREKPALGSVGESHGYECKNQDAGSRIGSGMTGKRLRPKAKTLDPGSSPG